MYLVRIPLPLPQQREVQSVVFFFSLYKHTVYFMTAYKQGLELHRIYRV